MIRKFFFPILLFFIIGCTDKDDELILDKPLEINVANISGKWYFKGGEFHGGTYESYTHSCETSKDYIEFQPNNILKYQITYENCQVWYIKNTTWSLDGDKLEMGAMGGIDPIYYHYVVKLTENELVLNEVGGPDSPNNLEGPGALHYYTRK